MAVEGVTYFHAVHQTSTHGGVAFDALPMLSAWRSILAGLDGIGQDDARYEGAGYGNISVRVGPYPGRRGARPFLISATQTGGLPCVSDEHFTKVVRYDPALNRVWSQGPHPPSSESMTHGAIYDLSPSIRAVIHVHCPVLFEAAGLMQLPQTDERIGYGTPQMAREMARLWRSSTMPEVRAVVMAGHEDGVITWGRTLAEAGTTLVTLQAKALALRFASLGKSCRPGTSA